MTITVIDWVSLIMNYRCNQISSQNKDQFYLFYCDILSKTNTKTGHIVEVQSK